MPIAPAVAWEFPKTPSLIQIGPLGNVIAAIPLHPRPIGRRYSRFKRHDQHAVQQRGGSATRDSGPVLTLANHR